MNGYISDNALGLHVLVFFILDNMGLSQLKC